MYLRRSLALKCVSRRFSSQAEPSPAHPKSSPAVGRMELTKPSPIKWKRPPFLKNLFRGKFDTELLAFPEILNKEEVLELESHVSNIGLLMKQRVTSMEIDQKRKITDELLQNLKDLGLFGRMIPAKYGGLDLSYTACTRINEVLGLDLSISSILAAHEFLATEVILRFGSEEQKLRYLPRLASGEMVAAFCCSELESGSDLHALGTRAVASADGTSFVVSGRKTWVANARLAQLFVLFARTPHAHDPKGSEISVFLVEKGEGLHIHTQHKNALHALHTGTVHFDEIVVPSSSRIGMAGNGFQVYLQALQSFRIASSSSTVGALKSLLDAAVSSITHRERLNKSLADFEAVRTRLSRINSIVYGMESAAYFTAAILDSTEDPDAAFEAAALKVFCSEGALFCLRELGAAVGASSLAQDSRIAQFHNDAQALAMFDSPNDMCRLFLGLFGCKDVADKKLEEITQIRNPFYYPSTATKRMYRSWKMRRGFFKFDQDLAGHIHPYLTEWGNALERNVQLLQVATQESLVDNGRGVLEAQVRAMRVSDAATELYVMAAVLSRASRSYCIGLRNSHHEVRVAAAYCYDANQRVEAIFKNLLMGFVRNNDKDHLLIGEQLIDCQGYFAEHPLRHNF